MKNEQATEGIENLKKTYEMKYNMDNLYLWVFDKYLDIENNSKDKMDIVEDEEELILCQNCKEIIGKKEAHANILFNKLYINSITFELNIDVDKDELIDIKNDFNVDYLNILLVYSINKGNKFLKFTNKNKNSEIIFETKMNIVGLIDKDNGIIEDNLFLIDNYINMFTVLFKKKEINEFKGDLIDNIYVNEQDFSLLENIIENNIKKYMSEFFFYKLLTNENKKYYCFSFPKKI